MHTLFFDGAKKDNSLGYGFVIYDKNKEIVYKEGNRYNMHNVSSNVSEWIALVKSLIYCIKNDYKQIVVFGDSQLIINQINGINCAKSPVMKIYLDIVQQMISKFERIEFHWVPRDQNKVAHHLSR